MGRKAFSYGLWLWQEPSEPPASLQLTEWGSGSLDPVSIPAEHCNSGSIQLWHCLPLPCCCLVPTGANLTVPPMDPPSCTTIPVLRCGCLWKSPIPRNSQGLQTTVARKQGVFLPRRTPRIFAPTTLQHSALMAQPFPQHIPQGTNKAVQECPGLQEPGRMWPRGYPVMVWPLGKSSILPWAI